MTRYLLPPGAWLNAGSGLYPGPMQRGANASAGWYPGPMRTGVGTDAAWYPGPMHAGVANASDLYPGPMARGAQANADQYPGPMQHGLSALDLMGNRAVSGMPAAPTLPWSGIDPAWVYDGGDGALLAQALRKVRDRVAGCRDDAAGTKNPANLPPTVDSRAKALWRWARPFRVKAIAAELAGRVQIEQNTLWWVPCPSQLASNSLQNPSRIFTLVAPGHAKSASGRPHFDYSLQIDAVLRAAVEREDRMPEILTQADNFDIFFDAITGIDREAAPHLSELMEVILEVATLVVMGLKHEVAEWRPNQRSRQVVSVIPTPGHGSLPSGHATIAKLNADLLSALLYSGQADPRRDQLEALARRIAYNRVVAGVHFPMDSLAGHCLGECLAQLFRVAAGDLTALPKHLTHSVGDSDDLPEFAVPGAAPAQSPADLVAGGASAVDLPTGKRGAALPAAPSVKLHLLPQLWQKAKAELASRRV